MDLVPRVPFTTLARACDSFSPASQIGSGATGAVFRGRLDGADVALKRLHVPEGASPAARGLIVRAFHAELWSLATYSSPRLVRLLCYAMDEDPASRHPFVLAFELLEGGSLADHLRGPGGEAQRAPGPPLTPLERVDSALGAAAGLAYLHGLREDAQPAAGSGGAAVPQPPQAPVLHRDVKSANIGLTRIAGALYAKVLDCGLARALRPPPSAAGDSISVTGVVGTLGYMAPELATGEYSPRSDIYALGCVLLELLSGARVGPKTARELEDRAIEDGEGVGVVAALAEACWPPPAAAALAALALACIHHSPKRRPGSTAEVLAALRALRAMVAPAPAAAPAAPLVRCPLQCGEEAPEASGLRCLAGGHYACHGCLQGYVRSKLEVAVLRRNEGRIPCYQAGQGCAHVWSIKDLQEALDKGTHVAFSEALVHMLIDGPREAAALAAAQAAAVAAAARLALGERVAALRRVIVERDLLLRCPHCAAEFDDYQGCNALTCARCGTGFCAVCLADCGSARATHVHYRAEHGEEYYDRPLFERQRRARFLARVVAAVRDAGDAAVQRALVAELGRADLRDLGIGEAEVLAGAGVAGAPHAAHAAQELPRGDMSAARVVELMRLGSGDAGAVGAGCMALAVIARSDPGQEACVASGAIPALVAALRAHAGVPEVVWHGCQALGAIGSIRASRAGHAACASLGAIPAVVAALTAHAGHRAVAASGCTALWLFTCGDSGAAVCAFSGAVPAVVAALTAHAATPGVAMAAFSFLGNICTVASGKASCLSSGAVPAVVAALGASAGSAEFARGGCFVLQNISQGSPSGQAACLSAGAVQALAAALKAHADVAALAETCCVALDYLAASDSARVACATSGAVPAVVAALKAHPGSYSVVTHGSHFLSELAACAPGLAACLSAGAVPALLAALAARDRITSEFGRERVAAEACAALDKLGYTRDGQRKH
jgi:hypothetical protein